MKGRFARTWHEVDVEALRRSSSDNADRPSSLNFSIRKTHTSMSYSTSSPLRTAVESSGCGGSAPAHRKKSMSCNITLNRIDEPVRGSGLRSTDSAAFDEFVAPPPTHSPPPPPTTAQLSPTSSSGSHASSDFSLPSSPLILHTPPATPPPSTHRPSFAVVRRPSCVSPHHVHNRALRDRLRLTPIFGLGTSHTLSRHEAQRETYYWKVFISRSLCVRQSSCTYVYFLCAINVRLNLSLRKRPRVLFLSSSLPL